MPGGERAGRVAVVGDGQESVTVTVASPVRWTLSSTRVSPR
ncbi:hypothetical protein [Nonomuraea sp. C10]|nr:hypothetical protein [Nonomuraea sp. C10]